MKKAAVTEGRKILIACCGKHRLLEQRTMPMKSPVHPGKIIKHDCIEASNLNITEASTVLGITRQTLSRLINEQTSVSPDMAIRISKAFGSTPEHWLRLQLAYDVAHMHDKVNSIKVKRYIPSSHKR